MSSIDAESGAVQSYLEILQSIINRMAANSAACKTWCITLVSAIVVVVADKDKSQLLWIAIIPVLLFLFLDSYYLGLEQRFRSAYNDFIRKLHAGEATIDDVFIVNPGIGAGLNAASTGKALGSISIWPFYILLTIMLIVVHKYVL